MPTFAQSEAVAGFVVVALMLWRLERSILRAQIEELRRVRTERDQDRTLLEEVRAETDACLRERAEDRATIVGLRAELAVANARIDHLEAVQRGDQTR